MTTGASARLPRYKRAARPPAMLLTERDELIVELVYELRFATQEQIQALLFSAGAASSSKRRLTLLYHNRYLDRRLMPLRSALGASRAVYCLDRRGAELLKFRRKTGAERLGWRPADNDRELYFLEHLVASNDFRVHVTLAARKAGADLSWIDERTLRIQALRHLVDDPKHPGRALAVIPDGYFTVRSKNLTQSFALELDRATVEEKPFKEKIRAVRQWKLTGSYRRTFGTDSLRVLFVVASTRRDPNRLARIKAWTEAEGGESLFWFVLLNKLTPANVLTAPVWQVANRTGVYALF